MSYDLKINKHAKIGEIKIYETPSRVRVETEDLVKRHSVWMRNYSSYYIYVALTEEDCVYGGSNAFIIKSGEKAMFELDRDNPLEIWCISKISLGAPLDVMEAR